ncbi:MULTISPECIES: glycosyltransferase [Sphingobacterium]|uniref:glycosyltransferase n=1 Tax=Sphingobacterium TaxID=28453 RepID=UPI0025794B62|nr:MULTISPECIES: glycosyltransferase [Sphingobacterium]
MKKKISCTLFPLCENVHLIKDVGMIPFHLAKDHNYEVIIATYRNGNYPYLETEVKGVKLSFIKKITGIPTIDVLFFLLLNAYKIDLLQCFHLMKSSLIYIYFFKLLTFFSSRRKTYLKMDVGADLDESLPKTNWQRAVIRQIDLISVENTTFYEILSKDPLFAKRILYMPNGITCENADPILYSEKKNYILTVGRLGSYQKSNHVLLQAFKNFCIRTGRRDWKLFLVGPIEGTIQRDFDTLFDGYSDIKSLVTFTGPVYDRKVLENYYRESKLFVLSSKFEGFPLVFLEALKNGCTILSTDFHSAVDITKSGHHGFVYPIDDDAALSCLFKKLAIDDTFLESRVLINQQEAITSYRWEELVNDLHKRLS